MNRNVWAIVAIACLDLAILWFIRGTMQPEELVGTIRPEGPRSIQKVPISLRPNTLETVEEGVQPVFASEPATQNSRSRTTPNSPRKPATEKYTARRTENIKFR